jgi:peptidoglycan/LPS O-acetylase OafA/YrhL
MRGTTRKIFSSKNLSIHSTLNKFNSIDKDTSLQIDSLRGLSAILVLVAHAFQIFIAPIDHSLYGIFGLIAQASVMLFFVLSGFLITKSITRAYGSGFSLSRYATDRANRILPPLAVSLILCTLLWVIAPYSFSSGSREFIYASPFMARNGFELDAQSIIGTVFFLNGFVTKNIGANAPLWSLPFEVWYYVAAGIIASTRGVKGYISAAILMLILGAFNKVFLLYSAVWFAGSFVCIAHNNNYRLNISTKLSAIFFAILASGTGAYYLKTFANAADPSQIDKNALAVYNLFIGLLFAALLLMIMQKKIKVGSAFSGSAKYSYTLYVIHFPILLFFYGTSQAYLQNAEPAIITAIACIAFCILTAGIVAKYAENLRIFSHRKIHPAT